MLTKTNCFSGLYQSEFTKLENFNCTLHVPFCLAGERSAFTGPQPRGGRCILKELPQHVRIACARRHTPAASAPNPGSPTTAQVYATNPGSLETTTTTTELFQDHVVGGLLCLCVCVHLYYAIY